MKHTDKVVIRGPAFDIAFAVCKDGSMPAKEFIEEELNDRERRRLDVLLDILASTGRIKNRTQFKKVDGPIYAFKRRDVRVGCFNRGTRWYLTHGFRKKSNHWPPAQVKRAQRIMAEHLSHLAR